MFWVPNPTCSNHTSYEKNLYSKQLVMSDPTINSPKHSEIYIFRWRTVHFVKVAQHINKKRHRALKIQGPRLQHPTTKWCYASARGTQNQWMVRTDRQLQTNRLSMKKNMWKFKTSEKLLIIVEEFAKYASNQVKKTEKITTCNWLDLETLGFLTDYA